VRLWNLKTRELIVTFFYGSDGEWVMWTPQGYYTGSAKGGEMVGWQVNHGPEHEADYVRGQQLRKALNRPDIIDAAIRLASASDAIRQAGLTDVSVSTLLATPPPKIHIWAPRTAFAGHGTIVVYAAASPQPIDRLDVLITNARGQETKVPSVPARMPEGAPPPFPGESAAAYAVPLYSGVNDIRVVASNAGGDSAPAATDTTHNGEGALDRRGTLYVLAVGVDDYPGMPPSCGEKGRESCDLRYAGADAALFAAATAERMGPQHAQAIVRLLVGPKVAAQITGAHVTLSRDLPTRANILSALTDIAARAGASDTTALFMAGHGENWAGGHYHLLPTDLARKDRRELGANVLDWQDDVLPLLVKIAGRRMLFLDACHAASARNRTLLNEANASSFTAFQAASGDQPSWEFAKEAHGAFTYVLVEGLGGAKEATDPDAHAVTVYSLGPYVKRVVQRRTNGEQTPEFTGSDFVLAR